MEPLTGKSYAITGGNSGIGLATAHELVRRGARVAIFGRNAQTLAAAQRDLGATTVAVRGDVTQREDLQRFFATVAQAMDIFLSVGGDSCRGWWPQPTVARGLYRQRNK